MYKAATISIVMFFTSFAFAQEVWFDPMIELPFLRTVRSFDLVGGKLSMQNDNQYRYGTDFSIGEPSTGVFYFDKQGVLFQIDSYTNVFKTQLFETYTVNYRTNDGKIQILGYTVSRQDSTQFFPVVTELQGQTVYLSDTRHGDQYEIELRNSYPARIVRKRNGVPEATYYYNEVSHLLEKKEVYSTRTGAVFSTTLYKDGKIHQAFINSLLVEEYTYNAAGFVQSIIRDTTRSYEYTIDSRGNWVEKIAIEAGIPTLVERRDIEYFE